MSQAAPTPDRARASWGLWTEGDIFQRSFVKPELGVLGHVVLDTAVGKPPEKKNAHQTFLNFLFVRAAGFLMDPRV